MAQRRNFRGITSERSAGTRDANAASAARMSKIGGVRVKPAEVRPKTQGGVNPVRLSVILEESNVKMGPTSLSPRVGTPKNQGHPTRGV